MEKVIRVFRSMKEADAAEAEEDCRSTPEQRIDSLLELQKRIYPDASEQRFARVYRITELKQS
jgi:hypothetical protein